MKLLFVILCFFLFTNCSHFQKKQLSGNLKKDIKGICLNASGKGRIDTGNGKHRFSFQSAHYKESANWILAINFPLQAEEYIEMDWSKNNKVEFISSLEKKLLKEKDLDPRKTELFLRAVKYYMRDIIILRGESKGKLYYEWRHINNEVHFRRSKFILGKLKNYNTKNYFGAIEIFLLSKSQKVGIELIFNQCE